MASTIDAHEAREISRFRSRRMVIRFGAEDDAATTPSASMPVTLSVGE